MKVIIQDSETKQFLTKDGKWTVAAVEAEKFVEPEAASKFAIGTTTGDFNVVIYFPGAKALKAGDLGLPHKNAVAGGPVIRQNRRTSNIVVGVARAVSKEASP